MKQALILANELAIERYRKKMLRPGYPQTIHDLQHHPFNAAEHLDLFMAEIQASRNDLEAFNILTDRLTDIHADWSPYGFNSYLIDSLKAISRQPESKIAPIDWDCFTPSAVKLFEGVVYRGTSSEPDKVFKKGFEDYNPSGDVSNYFKPRNLDVGVSTSRSFKVAEKYTRVSSRQGKSRFVYTIIYRGIGGVDIIETAKAKGLLLRDLTNPQLTRALEKDEVNIIEKIAPEQIYCVTEFLPNGTEKTTYNPNYNGHYIANEANFSSKKSNKTKSIKGYLYELLGNFFRFIGDLCWALFRRKEIDAYGHKFRTEEVASTPQMQEAEALYNQIKNKQSYELLNAFLHPSTNSNVLITPQPLDILQMKEYSSSGVDVSNVFKPAPKLEEEPLELTMEFMKT
jgi:hypothetical protein